MTEEEKTPEKTEVEEKVEPLDDVVEELPQLSARELRAAKRRRDAR